MFKTFEQATKDMTKLAADFTKATSDFYVSIPKSTEDMKEGFERLKVVFQEENEKTAAMWKTYQQSIVGLATKDDIELANKQAQDLLKAAGMSFLLVLPGTLFFLPFIISTAKEKGVDIVPDSFKKVFAPKVKVEEKV